MNKKQYKLRNGERAPREFSVQKAGETLERMLKKNTELSPDDVLVAAKNPKSALHHWFEWDDTEAAEQYRLNQARRLLRAVHITIITEEEQVYSVSIASSVDSELSDRPRMYTSTEAGLNDPLYREKILRNALRELKVFRAKYSVLTELATVIDAANNVLKTAKRQNII